MNLKVPRAGEPITESFLQQLSSMIAQRIIGGAGIRVEVKPGGVVIHNTQIESHGVPRFQPYNGE